MPRKTKTVTITTKDRDEGKVYILREMSASQAEDWAMRALEAISQRTEIPAGLSDAGMIGVFILGLKPVLSAPHAMSKPLLDEMFERCLSIQPGEDTTLLRGAGTSLIKPIGKMIDEDIEEVSTRVFLRDQIFELHTGFSPAAFLSQAWANVEMVAKFTSANTQTSPVPSAPSSPETQPSSST